MLEQTEQVSRRAFLKSLGLAAAATTVAAGTVRCASAEEAASIAWDKEVDVVVCGFGAAGGRAAAEAADNGAQVLLLEKMTKEFAGGATSCFYGLLGSSNQFDDLEGFADLTGTINDIRYYTMNQISDEFLEEWTREPVNRVGFVAKHGKEVIDIGFPFITGQGPAWYDCFVQDVEERANMIEVLYETPAMKLVQGSNGEVLGVVAYQGGNEDAPLYCKARKGVILSTGDYSGDPEMLNQCAWPGVEMSIATSPACTGDGRKMALRAGAALWHMGVSNMDPYTPSFRKAAQSIGNLSVPVDTTTIGRTVAGIEDPTYPSFIWVNAKGKRFDNESRGWLHDKSQLPLFALNKEAVEKQGNTGGDTNDNMAALGIASTDYNYSNLPFFMVFDQARMESGPLSRYAYPEDKFGFSAAHTLYTWSMDNQAELEKGWIVQADTIEELCALIGGVDPWGVTRYIDAEELKKTIAHWNEMCAAGVDEDFGRPAATMAPIAEEGPYYAIELQACALYSCGGMKITGKSEVVDWDDRVIPRLYAIGLEVNPGALVPCQAPEWSGTHAGRYCAALENWDA